MMRMMRLLQAAVLMVSLPFAAHAACSSPVGQEGDQVYNITSQVMQFCNGSNWISMAGGGSGSGGGGGADPRIGTINANQWCVGNAGGTGLDCTTAAPLTAEVDPKVGTLTNTKWCTTDGSVIDCTTNAPLLAEDDPQTGDVTVAGKWCVTDGSIIQCTADAPVTAEVDPKVGTLTNTKWCSTDGSVINCNNNPPTSAGTLTATKWCTTDGTLINCTSNPPVTTEVDPEVGDITTAGKWCTTDGTMVNCNSDAPTGVSTLDDLTDVDATTGVAVGSVIAYDGAGWVVSDAAAGSAITASSTGAVQFNSGGQLAGDTDNFFWDDANKRLGIGTSTTSRMLNISGTTTTDDGINIILAPTNNVMVGYAADGTGVSITHNLYTSGNAGLIGLYSNAAVQTLLTGSGSSYFKGGNVGIGTQAPSTTLTVEATQPGVAVGYAQLMLSTPDANTGSGISLRTLNTGSERIWSLLSGTGGGSSNQNFRIYDVTAAADRLNITSAGNVGISTTAPIAKLDVVGNVSVTGMIDVGHTAQACATGISGSIRYETTSDTIQVCTGSGWKSLASTTIAAGAGTAASSTGAIQFNSGNSFAGDTTNLFWDDANNRLGIGISTPSVTLHVSGSSGQVFNSYGLSTQFAEYTVVDETGNRKWSSGVLGDANAVTAYRNMYYIYQYDDQSDVAVSKYRMVIDDTGNVGIGGATTPTTSLQIGNHFTPTNSEVMMVTGNGSSMRGWSTGVRYGASTANPNFDFVISDRGGNGTGDTIRMLIDYSTGNTGFGTISPTATLQVSGTFIVSATGQTTTPTVYVTNAGYFGIGTNAPSTQLDVAGSIEYTGTITDVSDRRMKHDITALPTGALERMMLLKPVSFKMNGDAAERTEYGFIAQEVQEVYPILVNTSDDASKTLSLNYTGMIAPMVQSIQELKRENDALKARLDALEKRLNAN